MIRAILSGAVLIHPVLFLIAFASGMAFGANPYFGGGPAGASALVFGWNGGVIGMETLAFTYFITMGIAALIASATGAVVGAIACILIRLIRRSRVKSTQS